MVSVFSVSTAAGEVKDYVQRFNNLRCEHFLSARSRLEPPDQRPTRPQFWRQFVMGNPHDRWHYIRDVWREQKYLSHLRRHDHLTKVMASGRPIMRELTREKLRALFCDLETDFIPAGEALIARADDLIEDCLTPVELNKVFKGITKHAAELGASSLAARRAREIARRARELRFERADENNGDKIVLALQSLAKSRRLPPNLGSQLDRTPALKDFVIGEIQMLRRLSLHSFKSGVTAANRAIAAQTFAKRLNNDFLILSNFILSFELLEELRDAVLILRTPWLQNNLDASRSLRVLNMNERESLVSEALNNVELVQLLRQARRLPAAPTYRVPQSPDRTPPVAPTEVPLSLEEWEKYQTQLERWRVEWARYETSAGTFQLKYPVLISAFKSYRYTFEETLLTRKDLSTFLERLHPEWFVEGTAQDPSVALRYQPEDVPPMPVFESVPARPPEIPRPASPKSPFQRSSISTIGPMSSGWH